MANKFIVSFVDYNDTCSGKANVAGPFNTEDEAKAWVKDDMQMWLDNNSSTGIKFNADFDKMSIASNDCNEDVGCEWNVHEISLDSIE